MEQGANISSGEGSGLAQVISTRGVDGAVWKAAEARKSSQKVEKEKLFEDLSKINVDGIKLQDTDKINELQNKVLEKYASLNSSTDRVSKQRSKIEMEQAKNQLLIAIQRSKQANQFDADIKKTAYANHDKYDEETLRMISDNANLSSFDQKYNMDYNNYLPRANEVDVLKINQEILKAASGSTKSPYASKLGDMDGVATTEQLFIDPVTYKEAYESKLKSNRSYAKAERFNNLAEYKTTEDYKKNGEEGIYDWIANKRIENGNKFYAQQSATTFSQKGSDFNTQMNFNQGGSKTFVPNLGVNATSSLEIKKEQYNKVNGVNSTTTTVMTIPVGDATPFNLSYDTNLSNGYFNDKGEFKKSNETAKVTSTRLVTMPVYKTPSGYVLANSETRTAVLTQGGKQSESVKTNPTYKTKPTMVTFVEAKLESDGDENGQIIYQPLNDAVPDRTTKADAPALKYAMGWDASPMLPSSSSSAQVKQSGGNKTNNTKQVNKAPGTKKIPGYN